MPNIVNGRAYPDGVRSRWEREQFDREYRSDMSSALAVVQPPTIEAKVEAKAMTGPGAFAMTYHTPLHSFSRDPHRLMAEAQNLFHINGWVGAAERALGGRFVRMAWHLEDENGKTIDDKSPEALQAPLRLLQRPSRGKLRSDVMGITFRHDGLAGNAVWVLDELDLAAQTPLQVLYVNPARLTPAYDQAGNVAGWILDHPDNPVVNARTQNQSRTGVPLSVDEVIHFTLDEPDWGIWGIGVAEAAQRKIELDKLADVHAGGVLASGGRMSGLVTPKTGGTVQPEQWEQFVRDWRSITSDPDAAKRLQIAQMPLDFQSMTANPKDLQLIDVMKQGRDDVLAQWGVPLSQLGINVPAGLNADRSEADDAAIWETIKHRAEPIRETIQVKLLDRWEALGVKVTLIFDYPEFDDRTPLYEAAAKSISVAITNDERRAILGLEPLEDEALGKAIYIDGKLSRIDEEPEQQPTPVIVPPSGSVPPSVSTEDEEEVVEGKADLRKPLLGLRQRTEVAWEPKIRKVVSQVLGEQQRMVNSKLDHAIRKNDLSWWNEQREHKRFSDALDPVLLQLATEVGELARKLANKPEGKADTFLDSVLDAIRSSVGERISGINATTLDKVRSAISQGVEAGEGPADIGRRLQESAAFDESRAELVSRTETGTVFNEAAVRSYGALDVSHVQVIDGDGDDVCAHANGAEWSLDEALANPLGHPNCVRDFVPVI